MYRASIASRGKNESSGGAYDTATLFYELLSMSTTRLLIAPGFMLTCR